MPSWASAAFRDVASRVNSLYGSVVQSIPKASGTRETNGSAEPSEIVQCYTTMAAIGARALPEDIDDGLLQAWVAATRGESFELPEKAEGLANALSGFAASVREAKEAAEHRGGIELSDVEFQRRVLFALMRDESLLLGQAIQRVLDRIASGRDVGNEDERRAAYLAAKGRICDWLSQCEIEFFIEPPLILPGIVIVSALDPFSRTPDIYFHPQIPEEKLKTAVEYCSLPLNDWPVALIDCTIFGAADEAVLLGTRGMYYNDGTQAGYIPYSSFPKRQFGIVRGEDTKISLGAEDILDINGSKADVHQILGVLETLKHAAREKQKRMQRHDLLPPEPRVGESIGLAVYGDDGSILRFEVQATVGHGRIVPLGSMEPVMRESVEAAAQYVRANYRGLQIAESWADQYDVAVLAPGLGDPKDGPSAGIAIVAGIVSALTDRPIRNDLAMTGEITLKGRVLPIGGLDVKVRAAFEAGIMEVLFPAQNASELQNIPFYIRDVIRLTPVSSVEEALKVALLPTHGSVRRG